MILLLHASNPIPYSSIEFGVGNDSEKIYLVKYLSYTSIRPESLLILLESSPINESLPLSPYLLKIISVFSSLANFK